jgi:hypothetical protein
MARSILLEESQETSAIKKKPVIAGALEGNDADNANNIISILLRIAKIKLAAGLINRLAIVIGMTNTKRERPFDNSNGESANIKTTNRSNKKENPANWPDQ